MRYLLLSLCLFASIALAHQGEHSGPNTAQYLGNEAVLVESGDRKLLFDPFFHNDYGQYQKVPESIRDDIFAANAPFDKIAMVLISHAHEDHFSVTDVLRYMLQHSNVVLVAPKQAIEQLLVLKQAESIKSRMVSIALAFGDSAWKKTLSDIQVEAVRIPHAGWPGRADVENLVYRVTLNEQATVMHLGDADPQVEHYLPYRAHWDQRDTQLGFPPYWFFRSAEGREILKTYLHVKHSVGVHVPIKIPKRLSESGHDYFSKPGEKRKF